MTNHTPEPLTENEVVKLKDALHRVALDAGAVIDLTTASVISEALLPFRKDLPMDYRDLELRFDGPIPPTLLAQIKDPRARRKLKYEGWVAIAQQELPILYSDMDVARKNGHTATQKEIQISIRFHTDRLNLAKALLERRQFDG